ncbi:Serine/threonine-protein phosphatase [Aphelenchoides fujianensis]|nr:Serine/threonine-protein phosphatase [Aphelenchoides fujianensis]
MSTIDPQKWLPDVVQCRYLPQREMLQLCEIALKYIDRNVEVNTHGVLCDLLWSDPDEMDYGWAVNARGAGYRFAPNYCYRCGNIASVLKLDSDLQREVVYFDAVPNTAERVPERVVAPYFL